jgi:NodT family efflux transporter outer membrane factor (OMF) lipoprotein
MKVILLLGLGLLMACSRYHAPDQALADLPSQFREQKEQPKDSAIPKEDSKSQALALNLSWWEVFKNPQLNQMVEQLLSNNLSVAQAKTRVVQMRALATQAGSQLWPTLDLNLGFTRRKQLNMFSRLNRTPSLPQTSTGGTAAASSATKMPSSFQLDTYSSALAVSYELDLFGRLKSLSKASEIDAIATEQDMQAMALSLVSTFVDLWLQSIEAQQKLKLLESQLKEDEKLLTLSKSRFSQGLGISIDVLQQTQQRDRTRIQIPMLEGQIAILKRKMAALVGKTEIQIDLPESLPILDQSMPKLGVPSEVLFARPDIRAAHARLKAADARVSAAVSARYPAFRIGADLGYQSFDIKTLFDEWVGSIALNLVSPIFDAGRRASEQQRMEEMLKERVHALAELSLNAFNEIEDALTLERQQNEQLSLLNEQMGSAKTLNDRAKSRYLEGVGDFLTVVTSTQGLYQVQINALTAQRQALSYRVLFHKALGGEIKDLNLKAQNPSSQNTEKTSTNHQNSTENK